MDINNPLPLTLSEQNEQAKPACESTEGRFTRIETHIGWLRQNVKDIRGELKDIRGEIKDVRGEIKDVRKDMQLDFRLMFGALIAVALGLASLMAKGFHWL